MIPRKFFDREATEPSGERGPRGAAGCWVLQELATGEAVSPVSVCSEDASGTAGTGCGSITWNLGAF